MTFSLTTPMKYAHERTLGRPSCPRCGVLILVSETSAYVSEDLVRHAWSEPRIAWWPAGSVVYEPQCVCRRRVSGHV